MTDNSAPTPDLKTLAIWLATQQGDFAKSLSSFYEARGYLTPRQEDAARGMYVKAQAKAAGFATTVKPVAVKSGHYALLVDGVVKFYRVNSPTEGRWAGYTFVDAQASDDYYKVGRDASAKILAEIAADPRAALVRYGKELGKCGHCNRTLTDEVSRANGIGPVCARKMGW